MLLLRNLHPAYSCLKSIAFKYVILLQHFFTRQIDAQISTYRESW